MRPPPHGDQGRGSDDSSTGNIYAFDIVNQTEAIIGAYPAIAAIDIDGLTVDPAGFLYLIEDNPSPIHRYDLANGTYDQSLASPVTAAWTFSAAAWAPSFNSGGEIGTTYCGPQPLNSSGGSGEITATGSATAGDNDLTLTATSLPTNQFGYFLNSMTMGFVPFPNGSQGNLCLGGAIGRHVAQIGTTGAAGELQIMVDLTALPVPAGTVAVMAGDTYNFQAWYRDANPGPTSNFTDAVEITFN